ncbi:MAG TPA: sigma-70 family RNA polymerase sigma factor [Planctomycetaceae bacterium]|jgi:RNA polymerase sigma-70 factor (ECF subfamily)|nr:sigma-70 family RNA polymerase sigma factor [Planctomycetaceae bacterium]
MPLSAQQIAALIERHAVPLQIWLGHRCPSAEDVVQEVFRRLATLERPPERIAAWLYRAARNLAENQRVAGRRRQARERRAAAEEVVHHDPLERLMADEVVTSVLRLDEPLRKVVIARIWGQLTFEEIGTLCGISTATASRRYRDALEQLHKLLSVPCPIPTT